MKRVTIAPKMISPKTELYFGRGLLEASQLEGLLKKVGGRPLFIADPKVASRFPNPFVVEEKSEREKHLLEEHLFKKGVGKGELLVAVGGGTVLDLVGFVASTYLRGIPFVSIPTTLLAMVDASIGGKTAIDTPWGKNLLGTFYPPRAIIADPDVLQTLPKAEWAHGLAEMAKLALVRDAVLWGKIEGGEVESLIFPAMLGKIEVIERDPHDMGERRLLNFGHTIGHALEALSGYQMPHGEAVALGCVVESYLSFSLGLLSSDAWERIFAFYEKWPLPLRLPKTYERNKLISFLQRDKKGAMRFITLQKIGEGVCREIDEGTLSQTLTWMEGHYGLV